MKVVAICSEKMGNLYPKNPSIKKIIIDTIPITCGLLEVPDTKFDPSLEENRYNVLVKKIAFSCNFRDKSYIIDAAVKCNNKSNENKVLYEAFGSDFVGIVIAKGNDVKDLVEGDRVIPDGSYPDIDSYILPGTLNSPVGLPTNLASKELEVFHFTKLLKIPKNISNEVAASFSIGSQTSYSIIKKLNIKSTDKVLVTSANSNTSLFIFNALKKFNGISLFGLTTSMINKSKLKTLGINELLLSDVAGGNIFSPESSQFMKVNNIKFDVVIDPFWDLHFTKIVGFMNRGGRYISCGLYNQFFTNYTGPNKKYSMEQLEMAITTLVFSNISFIGNCLGTTEDLKHAVDDNVSGDYNVLIDSVYRENEVAAFIDRTYLAKDRYGKVVYEF